MPVPPVEAQCFHFLCLISFPSLIFYLFPCGSMSKISSLGAISTGGGFPQSTRFLLGANPTEHENLVVYSRPHFLNLPIWHWHCHWHWHWQIKWTVSVTYLTAVVEEIRSRDRNSQTLSKVSMKHVEVITNRVKISRSQGRLNRACARGPGFFLFDGPRAPSGCGANFWNEFSETRHLSGAVTVIHDSIY